MLTTPNRELQQDPHALTGYYQKWHQKRLELKEKVTEKLNDSFGGISPKPLPAMKPDKSPLLTSHVRKPTFFKQPPQINMEVTHTPRPLTTLGQYGNGKPNVTQEVDPQKGRFEEMLNTYFSSLSNKMVVSPSKEFNVQKKRAEVKEIIQGYKISPDPLEPKLSNLSKSPILKFKEQFDYLKKTAGTTFTATGTATAAGKSPISVPKTARATVVAAAVPRPASRAGLTIKFDFFFLDEPKNEKPHRLEDCGKKTVPKDELKAVQNHLESLTADDVVSLPSAY